MGWGNSDSRASVMPETELGQDIMTEVEKLKRTSMEEAYQRKGESDRETG